MTGMPPDAPAVAVPAARSRRRFDYVPVAVEAGAGLVGGILAVDAWAGSLGKYREGVYKGALVAAGVAGHFLDWDDDVTYGLLGAGAFAFAQQIGPAIHGRNARILLTDTAPQRAPSHGHTAGCSSCATAALRNPEAVRVGAPARPARPARAYLRDEAPGLF